MNLTLDLNNEILLLEKYKLTCDELMFIRVTLIFQEDGDEELFKNYYKAIKNTNINIRDLLLSLVSKGIILKSYKIPAPGTALNPIEIPFNKNFLKQLFRGSFEMGKELFEAYPQFTNINGNIVPLRSVSKKFDSLEDAFFKYGKIIKWNNELHNEIISLINWSKEHDILKTTLANFIVDNGWLNLRGIKDGEVTNVNYDAIKMI